MDPLTTPRKKRRISIAAQMTLGLFLGVAFGLLVPGMAKHFAPAGTAFIQAIKVIIVPMVFTVITLGVHNMGRMAKQLGKITTVSLVYFLTATVASIVIGLALNGIFHPGLGTNMSGIGKLPANFNTTIDWSKFLLDMIPSNIVAAMAGTNLLPVLVFSVALGLALSAIGERAAPMVNVIEAFMTAIFKITTWIVAICPYAVFAITAWLFATQGKKTIYSLIKLLLVSYIGLVTIFIILCILLLACGERPLKTFKAVSEPFLLGVGSRASEVTLPIHLEKLFEMGVPKGFASVVLPLGYVFNRDASIMYSTLAVAFVIDLYHIPITWQTLLSIVILMTVISKGSPNMPSGTLVIVAMVLSAIGLPIEGVAVILGIDAFIDMGRTGLNVFSNTVAIKVIMKICHIKYEQVGIATLAHAGDSQI